VGCDPLSRHHPFGNRPLIYVAVAAIALAGCGSSGGKPTIHRLAGEVRISSGDFKPGGRLPKALTCDGAGREPTLRIQQVPRGTKALALIVHDPDAPSGDFTHWTVYDIPPAARTPIGETGLNELGKPGYTPPCPPPGGGLHHYAFDLYALRGKTFLQGGASLDDVRKAISRLAFARGSLVGTYGR
jgi:Raf kinase inhibitor-like YbhB/YbcL family protein